MTNLIGDGKLRVPASTTSLTLAQRRLVSAHRAQPRPARALHSTRLLSIVIPLAMFVSLLAYVPLLPPSDPLASGFSAARLYQTALLIIGFSMVPLLILGSRHTVRLEPRSQWPLLIFCGWALASAAWSPGPMLSLSKSLQLTVIAAGTLFIQAGLTSINRRVSDYLPWVLVGLVITVLAANFILWGTPFALHGAEDYISRSRLRFAQGHAGAFGDLLAITILVVGFSSFSTRSKVLIIGCLTYLLILTDSRMSSVAVIVTIVLLTLIHFGNRARAIGLYTLTWIAVAYGYYVLRNDPSGNLLGPLARLFPTDTDSLNGRIPLWQFAISEISLSPLSGHGYYSSRYLLLSHFEWAGNAHNNWLELLLATGIIGTAFLACFIGLALFISHRSHSYLLLAVTFYMLVISITSIPFFVPELSMIVLLLVLNDAYSSIAQQKLVSKRAALIPATTNDTNRRGSQTCVSATPNFQSCAVTET